MQMMIAANTQDVWASLSFGLKRPPSLRVESQPFPDNSPIIEVTPLENDRESRSATDHSTSEQRNHRSQALPASQVPLTYRVSRNPSKAPQLHFADARRGSIIDIVV